MPMVFIPGSINSLDGFSKCDQDGGCWPRLGFVDVLRPFPISRRGHFLDTAELAWRGHRVTHQGTVSLMRRGNHGGFLLDLAERWITLHIPAPAQGAERPYRSTSRVRARAFYLVAGNQKLPVRVQNIR